ncbi:MAG: rod shape-determining protein MreC [Bacteroidota bacterium]
MRNLIAFFQRFRIFLVFALLQVVALSMYFTYSDFPRIQMLTTAGSINAEILTIRNDVTKHFNLEETNKQLQWENKRLREKLKNSLYKEDKGFITVDDTLFRQNYSYIPATVINSTFDKRDNYMTIDIGRNHGIKRGDGVFSSRGVVGIVHLVSDNYAVVKTVLSKNINIDVMVEKGGSFGLLKWSGLDAKRGSISGISNDMRIKKWSRVVTRGGSGIFPRGILVGRVEKKGYIEGKPLWDITVRFSEDFRSIQHVYVVKNLMQEELDSLQQQIPEDSEEPEL